MQSWDLRGDRLVVSCFLGGDKSAVLPWRYIFKTGNPRQE